MGETPREALIRMIGEIDQDVAQLDQQKRALLSRRWELVCDLDTENTDTDEFEAVTPAVRAQEPAWATLMQEVGPAPLGEPPVTQQPMRASRPREGYTPISIELSALDEGYAPTARVREINNLDDEQPQVHLLYAGSRRNAETVALCGARATGNYGWWGAVADNGMITLCLSCTALMRSDR